jgi:arsenate reductase
MNTLNVEAGVNFCPANAASSLTIVLPSASVRNTTSFRNSTPLTVTASQPEKINKENGLILNSTLTLPMLKIYVYLKCATCRKALKWLEHNQLTVSVHPIREIPPTVAELNIMLTAVGDLKKLFNTSGRDYKALNMKAKLPTLGEAATLKLLAANGNLVKRPFLLGPNIALIGFHEDEWRKALSISN